MTLTFIWCAALAALPTEHINGSAVDAWTKQPLSGVIIEDLDGRVVASSDAIGRFEGSVEPRMPRLTARHPEGGYEAAVVHIPRDPNGDILKFAIQIALMPEHPEGAPSEDAVGLPSPRHHLAIPERHQPATIFWAYNLPPQMPATIRVLRCPGTTCCSAPGDGIEEMPFEEYVKGVVFGEVGVFRSMSTLDGNSLSSAEREQGSAEVFKTLSVSSRVYALYWYLRRQTDNPGYDIRDGTCEQVYDDHRHPWVNAAVVATSGQILALSGGSSLEKFEYASSCKRLGTLPYGISASNPSCNDTIGDTTSVVACVDTWCGHGTSGMGHQTHPCDSGNCRCLVRGICQWGAAERSFAGQTYTQILNHYQPNLTVVSLGTAPIPDAGVEPITGDLVGYVREGDIFDTESGIAGAQVSLSTGASTSTNAEGYYIFSDLQPGQTVTVTATSSGFAQNAEDKYLDPAFSTWWKSIALQRQSSDAAALDDIRRSDATAPAADIYTVDGQITDAAEPLDTFVPLFRGDATALKPAFKDQKKEGGCGCVATETDLQMGSLVLFIAAAMVTKRRKKAKNRSLF